METCSFKTNASLLLFSKNLTQPYDVEGNIFFGKRVISEVQQWFWFYFSMLFIFLLNSSKEEFNMATKVCVCVCVRAKLTLCDPMDHSLPGSTDNGIFQATILEWVAMLSSRGSSQLRDQICISYIAGRSFTAEPLEKALKKYIHYIKAFYQPIKPFILSSVERQRIMSRISLN